MATLADIQNKIYSLTGADSTSYTNANMLIDLNLWNQKIVTMILDSQDEINFDDANNTTYPIFKVTLAANRDTQIPASINMLQVKTISVCYDGVNVYRGTPIDVGETNDPVVDSANATANLKVDSGYSQSSPRYDIKFGSAWLYPAPTAVDVAAGAYMMFECFRTAVDFTSSDLSTGTLKPGFDPSFHMMLAYGPAMEYATAKQLPQLKMILGELQDFETRLRRLYSDKILDRRYSLSGDYQSMK